MKPKFNTNGFHGQIVSRVQKECTPMTELLMLQREENELLSHRLVMTGSSENIIIRKYITSILHYPRLFGYMRPGATPATSHRNIISIFSFIFCQDREIIHFTFSYLPLFSVSFWASYFIPVLCQAWLIKPELCRESLVYGWRNSKLSKDKVDIKPVVDMNPIPR